MSEPVDLLWRSRVLSSVEHFSYRPGVESNSLRGTVVLPRDGRPTTISYQVAVGRSWEVTRCRVAVLDLQGESVIDVAAKGGTWWVDGAERNDLAGCTDIDLGWTPSTNTLPIRRTDLDIGGSATIRAAWITFPELRVRPADQCYQRTGERKWRYESDDFIAELTTDHLGFVVRYGEDLWSMVAVAGSDKAGTG
jgi:uncharacterized protein